MGEPEHLALVDRLDSEAATPDSHSNRLSHGVCFLERTRQQPNALRRPAAFTLVELLSAKACTCPAEHADGLWLITHASKSVGTRICL